MKRFGLMGHLPPLLGDLLQELSLRILGQAERKRRTTERFLFVSPRIATLCYVHLGF
jgi:hypothetical protein